MRKYATYTIICHLKLYLNPQIGQSLICYDCPSYGAECARPGDENFGELLECPDSPRAACVSIHRLTVIRRTHSIINYSLINMRQLQILFKQPKTWHRIICWFSWISLSLRSSCMTWSWNCFALICRTILWSGHARTA